jgi:hypothetical protein
MTTNYHLTCELESRAVWPCVWCLSILFAQRILSLDLLSLLAIYPCHPKCQTFDSSVHITFFQDYWRSSRFFHLLFWQTRVDFLERHGSRFVWWKHCIPNTAFHSKNIIPMVKHSGGSVMVWGCFAASGPEWLPSLKEPWILLCIREFYKRISGHPPSLVMQQDNNPKQTSKSTSEYLKSNTF